MSIQKNPVSHRGSWTNRRGIDATEDATYLGLHYFSGFLTDVFLELYKWRFNSYQGPKCRKFLLMQKWQNFGLKDKLQFWGFNPTTVTNYLIQKLQHVTTTWNSDSQCSNWNLFKCQFAIEASVLDNLSYWMFSLCFFNKVLFVVGFLEFGFDSLIVFFKKKTPCSCSRWFFYGLWFVSKVLTPCFSTPPWS